jgi:hypothetical protein
MEAIVRILERFISPTSKLFLRPFLALALAFPAAHAAGQGLGTSGEIRGTVTDSSGAVIPGASVEIHNPVSGYQQTATTDATGQYRIANVPFNRYHMSASGKEFTQQARDVEVRSSVPVRADFTLKPGAVNYTVNVEAGSEDVIENTPSTHTDIDVQQLATKLPSLGASSALSSLVTQASPGIAADSNGFFHPLGEHADTTFSIDGQPISDQQSRIYANQISTNAIDSLEVIDGLIPPEYGDKSSLVVRTTTRSGLGLTQPTGSFSVGYGSFGTANTDFALGLGNKRFGNFLSVDGVNSGRFLDTPEFLPIHDHGNAENVFDHFDWQATQKDTLHLNLFISRSWFQVPNQYGQQAAGQDQRQQNRGFDVSGFWTRIINDNTLLSINPYVRQDRIQYFPSANPFDDLPATLASNRRLTNAGLKTDLSYVKGRHNLKAGVSVYHTFLSENFLLGITDPAFPGFLDANGNLFPGLVPFNLAAGDSPFHFVGQTDIKQEAVYLQDNISFHNFNILAGIRGDNYNGISYGHQIEPRVGVSYQINSSGTVLRLAYSRLYLTPYNENLIVSSSTGIGTGSGGLAATGIGAFGQAPLKPATRNQYNAGFQQALGKHLVIDGMYYWKYTQGDYDFDVLFNTPLTFPIQWQKSKIDGFAIRVSMPQTHGLTVYSVLGHTRDRFFNPEVGGLIFNSPINSGVFRIDHDQAFQQTTHLQYQPRKNGPWYAFTWTYESGMVAGAVPFATNTTTPVDLTGLTADQQAQIGLTCGGVVATINAPLSSCAPNALSAMLLQIPAPGTENPDKNPPRVAPRNLFDMGVGWDNIFRRDRYKTNLSFTAVNITNKVALYNFLSTFSGTHFVTPRSYTAQITFTF